MIMICRTHMQGVYLQDNPNQWLGSRPKKYQILVVSPSVGSVYLSDHDLLDLLIIVPAAVAAQAAAEPSISTKCINILSIICLRIRES